MVLILTTTETKNPISFFSKETIEVFQVKIQPWPWSDNNIYIVSCRGVVKPGGADPWYNQGGPIKVGACKSFLYSFTNGYI